MTEAGSARRQRRGGGVGVGRVVVGVSVHSVLCFSGACVIPGLAWPLQSQRLAFSLDSHHGLSVRLAQSQQAWTTDHRACALKSCLDTAQSTMPSCICLQITKVAFSLSLRRVRDLRPPSILSSRITEFHPISMSHTLVSYHQKTNIKHLCASL